MQDHDIKEVELLAKKLCSAIECLSNEMSFNIPTNDIQSPQSSPPISVSELQSIFRRRSKRLQFFPDDLFAEPAWDMLLYLYEAYLSNRVTPISSVTFASGVPQTTALRWISKLEDMGMVESVPDRTDRRRRLIKLSNKAVDCCHRYFTRTATM